MKILLAAAFLLFASVAEAVTIGHATTIVTAAQTHTGDTNFSTEATLSAASLAAQGMTAGEKALVFVTASVTFNSSVARPSARMMHGSTAFDGSLSTYTTGSSTATTGWVYQWWTVWTVVDSEDLHLQIKTSNVANTVVADQIVIKAIRLSQLTENTHWWHDFVTGSDSITTSCVDGASVTMTPGGATTFLVLSRAQITPSSTGNPTGSRIDRSGEAATSVPQTLQTARDTTFPETYQHVLLRPYSVTAASNTFKEQACSTGSNNGTRTESEILALDLSVFRDFNTAYTNGAVQIGATAFETQAQTVSLTPTAAGEVWVIGWMHWKQISSTRMILVRLQVDGADNPDTATTDQYLHWRGNNSNDKYPVIVQTSVSLSAAPHTFDVDASTTSTTAAGIQVAERSLVAITLELAAGGGGQAPRSLHQYRLRR